MKQVLLIEDDQKLSRLLRNSIEQEGFAVELVSAPGDLSKILAGPSEFDLVVMDRLVEDADMRNRIPEIRAKWEGIPILVVSAINTPTEKAELINEGADDYLGKPFYSEEFIARIRSLARRIPEKKSETRKIGRAILDLTTRRITCGKSFEDLPQKEFLILNALSESRKVISRHDLLATVWGNVNLAETNLVEATVTNLRRRLAGLDCGAEIKNQRNVGYWLEG